MKEVEIKNYPSFIIIVLRYLMILLFFIGGEYKSKVTISLTTNDENFPMQNAVVRLWSEDRDPRDMYRQTVIDDKVHFEKIPFGAYTLSIVNRGVIAYSEPNWYITSKKLEKSVIIQALPIGSVGVAGGVVFFDKGLYTDGWRYLEAAPLDTIFEANWYTAMWLCHEYNSERMTINEFNDWRVPTLDELSYMYENLEKGRVISNLGLQKWSSNQDDSGNAWSLLARDGMPVSRNKDLPIWVRVVRGF